MRSFTVCFVLLSIITLATPALAVDGVLEINQTCAVQTGCFSGDGPGFPVTIAVGGSYRLTSDLVVTGASTSGIDVNSPNVSLDLNGFTVGGPGFCSGAGSNLSCSGSTGLGIDATRTGASGARRFHVKNGYVQGFGGGVHAFEQARVKNVSVVLNNGSGIVVGFQSEVSNCNTRQNAGDGIRAIASIVRENTSSGNSSDGIQAGEASLVVGNATYFNNANGIHLTGSGTSVSGNTVYSNGGSGINSGNGALISGNTVYSNGKTGVFSGEGSTISGNTVTLNSGDGIYANLGCMVSGNTVRNNGAGGSGYGISGDFITFSINSGFRDNVIYSPVTGTRGTVDGFTADLGGNLCNGSTNCQ